MLFSLAALIALAAGSEPPSSSPPCRIPRHALILEAEPQQIIRNEILIYDRDTATRVCTIKLPLGTAPGVTVAPDGRIFATILAEKATNYSTDAGHVDVIAPDGRLLHQITKGVEGARSIAQDSRGHFFVSTGWGTFVEGGMVSLPGKLLMYDANSIALLRTFDVGPTGFNGDFELSPDGRSIAAIVDDADRKRAHIDVFDTSTGNRTQRIPVPRLSRFHFDAGNQLVHTDKPVDEGERFTIFEGVRYTNHDTSTSFLQPTTQIIRTEVSSGKSLPPIDLNGSVYYLFPIDPDPSLASAPADPSLAPPEFPTVAQLHASVQTAAAGSQFDETISGKRYSYLGNLARLDDPRANAITIVDCTHQIALVANTLTHTYRTHAMDPVMLTYPASDIDLRQLRSPATITLTFSTIPRGTLHSSLATIGYEARTVYALGPGQSTFLAVEQEFAADAPIPPPCGQHTFGGEPMRIVPWLESEQPPIPPSVAAHFPNMFHIIGSKPTLPANAFRVHVEISDDQARQTVLDIPQVHELAPDALTLFELPENFTQDKSTVY